MEAMTGPKSSMCSRLVKEASAAVSKKTKAAGGAAKSSVSADNGVAGKKPPKAAAGGAAKSSVYQDGGAANKKPPKAAAGDAAKSSVYKDAGAAGRTCKAAIAAAASRVKSNAKQPPGDEVVFDKWDLVLRVAMVYHMVGRFMMVAWPYVWRVVLCLCVLWRIDKLVFWGPGLAACRKQQALTNKVRQAATSAPGRAPGSLTSDSAGSAGCVVRHSQGSCSFAVASTHINGGMSVRITLGTSTASRYAARSISAVSQAWDCVQRSAIISNPVVSFVMQALALWWPRACYAVSSYAPLVPLFVVAYLLVMRVMGANSS